MDLYPQAYKVLIGESHMIHTPYDPVPDESVRLQLVYFLLS
jgi:hypothetical protein